MSAIDSLIIFDRFAPSPTVILHHEWRTRTPATAVELFGFYNTHAAPRPSLIFEPSTEPPTLLFSMEHSNLLLLSPATAEIEPLLVLEFLHRVVDVLEDYLGSPLMAQRIENNYDIVAQLLNEMADDGFPFTTEPNALKDLVLPPSLMGKLIGSVTGLPSSSISGLAPSTPTQISTIPWRRANVKHTNNELYVDLIELVTATIAPSGRALAARANGTIAFTSKLSGIPDILLQLQPPASHKTRLGTSDSFLENPLFHPCVRLTRWRDRPGELSFVPPDGKFVLASYEVDLLGADETTGRPVNPLLLPVSVEMQTGIGVDNNEFEVRVLISTSSLPVNTAGSGTTNAFGSRSGTRSPAFGGSSTAPLLEEVVVTIPLPPAVRSLSGTRCSRGDFHHEGGKIEWRIPTPTGQTSAGSTATLRTGVQARFADDGDSSDDDVDDGRDLYQVDGEEKNKGKEKEKTASEEAERRREILRKRRVQMSMPRSVLVAFSVRGWLASGVRVDSVRIVGGKGLGENVKPYKGVKYVTRSGGIEVRC